MVMIIEWWDNPVTTLYYEIKLYCTIMHTYLYIIIVIIIICNHIVYCIVLYIIDVVKFYFIII